MSGPNLGPVASRLVFLSELRSFDVGDKVRFLGWYVTLSSPQILELRLVPAV